MACREVLEQVCENCNQKYCTIRELLAHSKKPVYECGHLYEGHDTCENLLAVAKHNFSDRTLLQVKCIEELRWIKGQQLNRELDWNEATQMWIDEGYAKTFAEVYNRGERNIYFFYQAGTVPQRHPHFKRNETLDKAFPSMNEKNKVRV